MATAELPVELPTSGARWVDDEAGERAAQGHARAAQILSAIASGCLLIVDFALVVGAFLLAHWYRFVVPDIEAYALGLEQYARIGAVVSLMNVILLALDGWYDPDQLRARLSGCVPSSRPSLQPSSWPWPDRSSWVTSASRACGSPPAGASPSPA